MNKIIKTFALTASLMMPASADAAGRIGWERSEEILSKGTVLSTNEKGSQLVVTYRNQIFICTAFEASDDSSTDDPYGYVVLSCYDSVPPKY